MSQLKYQNHSFFPEESYPLWLSTQAITVFLLTVTGLFFGRFLSPLSQQVLSRPNDLSSQFIWWRQFGFEELKKGHLALWNPHLFGGTPFFGGFQSALLYPFNWFYMFLPMAFTMNFIMALHTFLAGWFTFLWIKKRGSHPASALLAALMYMFSGAYFIRILAGHLSNLCAMTWIPLIFLAVDGYRSNRRIRWILLGAFAIALQVFSGHIQYVYYTSVLTSFYVLLSLPRLDKKVYFLTGFVLMYMGGAFLSAIQLLAGWDATSESVRAQGMSLYILDMLDMNTERLVCFFMPNFFGGWKNYWGGGIYYEGHPFVSVTGIVLAIFALKASSHPDKKIFAGMGLVMTILMLGTRTPLFFLFCKFFPLFDHFRGVSKLNIMVVACLAVLAAMGLDEVLKSPKVLTSLTKATSWGSFTFGFVSIIFFLTPRLGGGKVFKQFLVHSDEMAFQLLVGGFLLAGLAFLAYASRQRKYLCCGFLILAFLELLVFANDNLSTFDLTSVKEKTASIIQKTYDQDPGDYRVYSDLGDYTLETSGFDIWGSDPMILYRYGLFLCDTQNYDFDNDILKGQFRICPALGLLRLRYIFKFADGQLSAQRSGLKESPRYFLTDQYEVLKFDEIRKKVIEPGFALSQEVLLESVPGIEPQSGGMKSQITLKDISTDQIEIHATLSKPAILVMTDNYSKGWKVRGYADSAQSSYVVMPANGFQKAIPLEAGEHHILMEYRPTAFVIGLWVSWVSWVLLIGMLFLTVPLSLRL